MFSRIRKQTPCYSHAVRRVGKRLFALALDWRDSRPSTAIERQAVIRAMRQRKRAIDGSRSIRNIERIVRDLSDTLREERRHNRLLPYRAPSPFTRGLAYHTSRRQGACQPRRGYRLPTGPLKERLRQRTQQHAHNALLGNYRIESHDHLRIALAPSVNGVDVTQSRDYTGDYYRGRARRWPKLQVQTTIYLPSNWLRTVYRHDLACVDGLLTLAASPLSHPDTPAGVELFGATWLVQGAGYTLHIQRGVIARQVTAAPHRLREAYHGDSIRNALRGLLCKLAGASPTAATVRDEKLIAFATEHPDAPVCVADAAAIGACEFGIQSWCAAVGLDYAAGSATFAAVYAAYRRHPLPEARRTLIAVMRLHSAATVGEI